MTIRTMAKILGISPAYLSLLINGKRKWKGDLKERYETLVNTFVNREASGDTLAKETQTAAQAQYRNNVVELRRLELLTSSMPLRN